MDENTPKDKKQAQYGAGSGTQEREQNITGSLGVQNKQGRNVDQGSTTGQKGGPGLGQQNQNVKRDVQQGQPPRNVGNDPKKIEPGQLKGGESTDFAVSEESEDE